MLFSNAGINDNILAHVHTSIPTKFYENGTKLMKNTNSCNDKNCSLRHSNILSGSINDLILKYVLPLYFWVIWKTIHCSVDHTMWVRTEFSKKLWKFLSFQSSFSFLGNLHKNVFHTLWNPQNNATQL